MDMSTDFKSETTTPEPDTQSVNTETPGTASASDEINQQLQVVLDKISGVLANLPDYVTDFFKEYKRPLVTVGLILAAFISVKLEPREA